MSVNQQQGAFSWCELITSDVDAAKDFYQKLFGWSLDEEPMGEGKTYTVIKAGERQIGGMMLNSDALGPEVPPPNWGVYVTVEDVDETVKLSKSMGATIIVPPTDIPDTGRFAVFADPQGAVLAIVAYK